MRQLDEKELIFELVRSSLNRLVNQVEIWDYKFKLLYLSLFFYLKKMVMLMVYIRTK